MRSELIFNDIWCFMMAKNRLFCLLACIGALLSLLAQFCVRATLELDSPLQTVPFIPGILHWTYAINSAAAFSLLRNERPLFILIRLGVILFIITGTFFVSWVLSRFDKRMTVPFQVGIGLLLAGSISNAVEKMLFNNISVFIDIKLVEMPIINLADIFIYFGEVIVIFSIIFLGIKYFVSLWR